jgi:hypothetical protein
MIEAKAKTQTINESIEMAKVHIFSENAVKNIQVQ